MEFTAEVLPPDGTASQRRQGYPDPAYSPGPPMTDQITACTCTSPAPAEPGSVRIRVRSVRTAPRRRDAIHCSGIKRPRKTHTRHCSHHQSLLPFVLGMGEEGSFPSCKEGRGAPGVRKKSWAAAPLCRSAAAEGCYLKDGARGVTSAAPLISL